jgi:hypothetical protein
VEKMADYTHTQTLSGWTKNDLGLKWLEEHFEPSTRKNALKDDGTLRKRLLLFDDHGSHCTFEFLDCCRWNDIIPFKLPPHTSWKLQPLDVAVFGPYKQYVLSAEKHWYERFKRRIGKEEFIEILLKERHSAMTPENILSGFRKPGNAPFDPTLLSRIPSSTQTAAQTANCPIKNSMEWIFQVLQPGNSIRGVGSWNSVGIYSMICPVNLLRHLSSSSVTLLN